MAARLDICLVHVDREWNDGNAGSRNTTALIPSAAFLLRRKLNASLIFEAGDLAKHPHEAVEADANC